jgi:uncharacterized protein (UPF0305 family)
MKAFVEMVEQYKHQLLQMRASCTEQIAKLPRGSLTIKRMGTREYWYLKYREGKKVVSKYIGKVSDAIDELKAQIKKRQDLEKDLKKLDKELDMVDRFKDISANA